MPTNRLQDLAWQELPDDEIDELLSRLAGERERLRRSTPMQTCAHCLNPIADSPEQYDALDASPDAEPCPCLEAACGHRLCAELGDCPPCPSCSRCANCCPCLCEVCGTALHASEMCACVP